jgi:hypothetical protein
MGASCWLWHTSNWNTSPYKRILIARKKYASLGRRGSHD